MAVDLNPLIARVASCDLLHRSVEALVEGLADLLEVGADPWELARALRRVPSTGDDIGMAAALTRGTSHVAVHPADPLVDTLRAALEKPTKDRAAHIASIEHALSQPQLDLAARNRALEIAHVAELRDLRAELDEANAEIARLKATQTP